MRISAQSGGQGFMVKENSSCWILLPSHLLGITGKIEVESSPAPSIFGRGRAFADFWDGMDFAIGFVEQASFDTACNQPMDVITQPSKTAVPQLQGTLRFTQPGGALSQYPMTIVDTTDHKTFVAEFNAPDDRPQQGVSGAFMFAAGAPIGMAIRTPDGARKLTFLRIEEISFAVQRWIGHRARAVTAPVLPVTSEPDGALPLKLEAYDTPSVSPETGPENLATGNGAYHFNFTKPVTLTFGVTDGEAKGVSRVVIKSEGDGAKPLGVRVSVDAGIEPSPHPVYFAGGNMSPAGVYDSKTRREKFARRVVIQIESVQGAGPVRIDRVDVY